VARVAERAAGSKPVARVLEDRRDRLRSRVTRLHATHSYRVVLLFITASLIFGAVAGDATWTTSVLLVLGAATLAAAMWTSGLARADSRALIALLAGATVVAVALPLSGGTTMTGSVGLVSGLLVVAAIAAIAIGVIDQDEVNAQSITGAICIYLLLGLLFLFLYSATALIGSGSFFAQGTDGTRSLRLYFSYVTLATLGYGDYTPAGNLGHMLAVLEALLGQLYLVTILALLVSRLRVQGSD
jgi:hypothetical protein